MARDDDDFLEVGPSSGEIVEIHFDGVDPMVLASVAGATC